MAHTVTQRYTPAQTAACIRKTLKAQFPACKFSVRTSVYAGGSSISVRWTDGPTVKAVESVIGHFEGRGFDGAIDLGYAIDAWVLSGAVVGTRSAGTAGSRGSVPAWGMIAPHDDAELVSFGSSFVFTERRISPAFANKLIPIIAAYWGGVTSLPVAEQGYDGYTIGQRSRESVRDDVTYEWGAQIRQAAEDRTAFLR